MKKIILVLLVLVPCFMAQAQDVLLKRNGDEIQVKVQEIGLEVIKYKRFDNLQGPVILIAKQDVFMITYENGIKEVFNEPATGNVPQADGSKQSGYRYEQEHLKLSGPRIGFTVLTDKYRSNIRDDYDTNVNAFMTQFGWQFETRVFTLDNGVSGLFEFVPLVGGLEQGKFLPSLSALIGVRGAKGFEFGLGPNVSLGGAGVVMAVGTNFQSQGVNFPVNFAFAPSKDGGRFSLLFGFNSQR
ncbi:hypothetical protein [uncultured Pontibacter sp.]|uniref:hypothetical protein n=1 Tax=uncultured Pontibacter sp. TaxID=453356 RepID=UPI00260F45C9|nr:hypothetical protein [uncultured Pontibacter sp.]